MNEKTRQILEATQGDWAFTYNVNLYMQRVHKITISDRALNKALEPLVDEGLVEKMLRQGSAKPKRTAYRITEAGKRALSTEVVHTDPQGVE